MSEVTTAGELLGLWDSGQPVWTVEMGGLGPGYEQAIQILTMELVRDYMGKPEPTDAEWPHWGDATIRRVNAWPGCGFSGAQVGAAKSLAVRYLLDGHKATLDSMRNHDAERLMLVSKDWPHNPVSA